MPFVLENACPFECCTYGDWTAEEPIAVHVRRTADSRTFTRIGKGRTFKAVGGRVVVAEPGRVSVSKPHELCRLYSLEKQEWVYPHECTEVPPGDVFYPLNHSGEGQWNVWYEGEVYQDNGMDWRFGRRPETRSADEVSATLEQKPELQWWVRVRTDEGGAGWILMDDTEVSGHDACAWKAQ